MHHGNCLVSLEALYAHYKNLSKNSSSYTSSREKILHKITNIPILLHSLHIHLHTKNQTKSEKIYTSTPNSIYTPQKNIVKLIFSKNPYNAALYFFAHEKISKLFLQSIAHSFISMVSTIHNCSTHYNHQCYCGGHYYMSTNTFTSARNPQ